MTPSAPDPIGFLPLTPRFLHILLALVDGEAHGYQIMKDVEARSRGRVTIGPGTLYEAIQRLVGKNLIVETEARGAKQPHDERRRYYRLTPLGRRVLQAEAERLDDLVGFARSRKLLGRRRPA